MTQRRFLLGLLFLTAPFDLSKAIVPPLDRYYTPGLYVTIGQAIMLMLGVSWGVDRMFVRRLPLPFTKLDGAAAVFLLLVWIGALHSQVGMLGYASAVGYSLCVIGFYVVSHTMQTHSDLRLMMRMVIIGLVLEALYVAAQMATHSFLPLPGSKVAGTIAQQLTEAMPTFRPIGGFDHPNALADYMTLLMPTAFALVLMSRRRLPISVWNAAAIVFGIAGMLLLLTLSRGGWAAFLLGAAVVGVVFWRKRLIGSGHLLALAGMSLAALVAVVAIFPQIVLRLTEPDSRSTESRIVLTDQALTIIEDHPLIGVGFGGYNRAAHEYTPPAFAYISEDYQEQLLKLIVHNHYLLLAAELGIPAMLYWIFLIASFVRQAWPLTQWKDPGTFALAVGLAAALASQMLFLSSDNYYTDIRVFLLWLTAGVLQAMTLQAAAASATNLAAPAATASRTAVRLGTPA